eukprot:2136178-Pleurochrysis_carterae.AAC.2
MGRVVDCAFSEVGKIPVATARLGRGAQLREYQACSTKCNFGEQRLRTKASSRENVWLVRVEEYATREAQSPQIRRASVGEIGPYGNEKKFGVREKAADAGDIAPSGGEAGMDEIASSVGEMVSGMDELVSSVGEMLVPRLEMRSAISACSSATSRTDSRKV